MINITEEQRDRLLDLCQTSKSVSEDYNKISEIQNDILSLPQYLQVNISLPCTVEMEENIEKKLNDINNYLTKELWLSLIKN